MRDDFDRRWSAEAGAVLSGLKEWRLAVMRARLLGDAALASDAADPRQGAAVRYPQCGERMAVRRRAR